MNEMKAGLGAITAGAMPRSTEPAVGAPRQSMEEMMSAARKMSDSQLADVLAGKNMEVPQFVAMTEAMGRKQLRTAMEGAQAQQQGQQPSIKDQMLAEAAMQQQGALGSQYMLPEEQGIGALPAPNMEQIDGMAGGGIVAFAGEDESLVREKQTAADRAAVLEGLIKSGAAAGDIIGLPIRAAGSGLNYADRLRRATGLPDWLSMTLPKELTLESGLTPLYDQYVRKPELQKKAEAKQMQDQLGPETDMAEAASLEKPVETVQPPASLLQPKETASTSGGAGAGAEVGQAPQSQDRFAEFKSKEGELEKTLEEQKNQSQAEFLMQLGASLLSAPTLAKGVSEGIQKALPALISNKREASKLRQQAKEFNFNVAKAEEAASMGDKELAFKYQKLASDQAYQTGILAARGGSAGITDKVIFTEANKRLGEMLKQPLFASKYRGMSDAQKQQVMQSIVQEVRSIAGSIGGNGLGMSSTGLPPDILSSVNAEIAKRGGGE